ncbi:hypothetical protein [Leuconostoc citreum]|uniref:hypothetical protein n=1 Tax=Leuconostoc citreum TaxID=33964 RepID=UPI0018E277CE|nr:hypothetical protein [Leuconostoc citreum]
MTYEHNDSLNTVKVTPQAGFDFAKKFGTELKLINVVLTGGEARSNQRAGARVVTRIGTLLEMSENGQDEVPEVEFDAVFITGKDKTPFGRIRSAEYYIIRITCISIYYTLNIGKGMFVLYDEYCS